MEKIRIATLADVQALMPLYRQLFSAMAQLQPNQFATAGQDASFLKKTVQDATSDLIVAEHDDRLIGLALLQEQVTPPYTCLVPHHFALLVDLVVAADCRCEGVGYALLGAAKEWARVRRLEYLELSVLANNARAISFYHKHGFQDAMKTMQCLV